MTKTSDRESVAVTAVLQEKITSRSDESLGFSLTKMEMDTDVYKSK